MIIESLLKQAGFCNHYSSSNIQLKLAYRYSKVVLELSLQHRILVENSSKLLGGLSWGFPGKESACNAGDPGSIPGSRRSPEGNGYALQHSPIEKSMDRGAWQGSYSLWGCKELNMADLLMHACRGLSVKNPLANEGDTGDAGDAGLIPGWGRFPWGVNGNPLQYFLPGKFQGQRSLVGYSP